MIKMHTFKCTRLYDRIIFGGVPLLGAAIAIAVSLISMTPLSIKSALLQSGVTALFAVWVVKTVGREPFKMNGPQFRLFAPAFLFMLSALFNFLFVTTSKDTSLDELMLRVPYFLIFFIGAVAFRNSDRIRQTLTVVVATSFIVSLYGILQHFGIDPLEMGDHIRIQSTFGNPNFYVGFLTLVIPVVGASFDLKDTGERKKAFAAGIPAVLFPVGYYLLTFFSQSRLLNAVVFVAMLSGVCVACLYFRCAKQSFAAVTLFLLVNNIFMTGSRSGLIGLGAGLIIFTLAVLLFVMPPKSLRQILTIASASLLIAGLVTAGVLRISYSDENRLKTVSERKYYVEGALNLINQKPVFGHGIGTFKNNYPLIKKSESWAYNATCFEHVSNVYNEHLEILHDEGIVGLGLWIWLLAAVFLGSFRALRASSGTHDTSPSEKKTADNSRWSGMFSSSPPILLIGLTSGTGALLIGNIFSLSMRYVSTGYFFWLFMGFIAALVADALKDPGKPPAAEKKSAASAGPVVLLLDAIFILAAASASIFAARVFLADVYLNRAVNYSKDAYAPVDTEGEVFHDIFIEGTRYRSDSLTWEKAIRLYRRSLSYNPFNLRARYFFGNAFNRRWNRVPVCNPDWGDEDGKVRTDFERAMEQYEYVIRQAPHYTEIDFELGDIHVKLGNIDKAIAAYKDYKRYKPFFTKIHYALATAYVAKNNWTLAAESYKDALDLNNKFTRGYLELSAVYRKMEKPELAQDMFERAREVSPEKAHLLMADVWKWLHETDREIGCLYDRIAEDSTDAIPYARLGWHYIEKKEWQKAISMYEKAVRWDSTQTAAWVNLSNLYYENRQIDKAKKAYLKAMKTDSLYVQSIMMRQSQQR